MLMDEGLRVQATGCEVFALAELRRTGRISDFGFRVSFGFRISDFGFQGCAVVPPSFPEVRAALFGIFFWPSGVDWCLIKAL
jgi:hypothetical protein